MPPSTNQDPTIESAPNQIDLWLVPLDLLAGQVQSLCALLSAAELDRADRFHFDRDRRRFVVARAALRTILADCLAVAPAQIEFENGAHGKPRLASAQRGAALFFNSSHSDERALVAVTRAGEVGVDIERVKPMADLLSVARHFFAPVEVEALLSLPAEQREQGFFNCWTRKEAFIKAIGEGLSHPLDRFAVSLRPGETARFLSIGDEPDEAAAWSLAAWQPSPGFVAGLAIRRPAVRLLHHLFAFA